MKSFAVLAVVAVAVMVAILTPSGQASPVSPVHQNADTGANDEALLVPEPSAEGRADRHKRVTCDLMSVEFLRIKVKHAACATHCLAMMKGYKGGRCRDGVCHCRK